MAGEEVVTSAAGGAAAGSWLGPVGAIGGAIIGGLGSYFSGKSAADYAEESYKHRYRWMVKDLKKAGLNPMLAVSQGPGSPPQPQFPNVGEAAVEGGAKGAMALSGLNLVNAQTDSLRSSAKQAREAARKTGLEGDYQETVNLYSARKLGAEADLMEVELDRARQRLDLEAADLKGKTIANVREEQLSPLLVEYQRYMNRARQLEIPEKKADADFWEGMEMYGKFAPLVLQIIKALKD